MSNEINTKKKRKIENMNQTQEILDLFKERELTTYEIQEELGYDLNLIQSIIHRLRVDYKKIKKVGKKGKFIIYKAIETNDYENTINHQIIQNKLGDEKQKLDFFKDFTIRDLLNNASKMLNRLDKFDRTWLFQQLKKDLKNFDFEDRWFVSDSRDKDNEDIYIIKVIDGEDNDFYNLSEIERKVCKNNRCQFLVETLLYFLFRDKKNIEEVSLDGSDLVESIEVKKEFPVGYDSLPTDFYGTTEWILRCIEILKKYQWKCQIKGPNCLIIGNLVHHIRSAKNNPQMCLDPNNLICVCENCHELLHKNYFNKIQSKDERKKKRPNKNNENNR
ncbi:MAG: hypothetical protein ACFFDH_03350 [Promethearchaeota archaeon]